MNANRESEATEQETAFANDSFTNDNNRDETSARLLVLLFAIAYTTFVMNTLPATTLAEATIQEALLALPLLSFVLFVDQNLKRCGIATETAVTTSAAPISDSAKKHNGSNTPHRSDHSEGRESSESTSDSQCKRVSTASTHITRTRRAATVAVGLMIAAACIGGIASIVFPNPQVHAPTDPLAVRIALAAALCLLTGVFEELLFRGIAFTAFESAFRSWRSVRNPARAAAIVQAALFALLHVSLQDALLLESPIAGAQALLKILQAFLFGMIMAGLFARTRSLLPCVVAHAAFDCLYLGPAFSASGMVSVSYMSGSLPDLIALTASTALIACAAWLTRSWLGAQNATSRYIL
ncbi:CPBP family intramembrane glutamic endopeptidase [Adlercreutzia sp. ZJ141]|uniref:CPBP family intramembrane glutamic endopeptidase n=1 Tax=Adlercreutzia sp. ZJ141 TaxID=2709406 RepID=UPI0013EC7B81|nr:CPBP family intramembrane glutamic endopeptidase [Adlercreutzia sp. ZJ141]